ncbi:diguanylate cyclase [Gracilibacillus oryzae]|uniref:Diguanylate cyclase n=1 Tax=Gracilibacillus oryzae TaxID=1672701 RepID=A0A7C8GS24_9BACI|nr:diguanylate cyclase [Gracilibacillus oryzae]KAB8130763.1 diguanylate cyclase [Gracilibacillus oryzae]
MRPKLFIILFFTMILQACGTTNESVIKTQQGKLDLTEWNQDDELIPLYGEWEFYWNQLLEPEDFSGGSVNDEAQMIDLPAIWNTHTLNGQLLPSDGYATFRLHISIPDLDDVLGLQLPIMYSANKLWVDNQLIAENGQVGKNRRTSVPEKHPQVAYFWPKDHTFTITLQISNYHHINGGMLDPIILGTSQNINVSNVKEIIFQSFLIGFLVLAGIYHIGLGFFRKVEPFFYYFGILCLVAAFRYLMVGDVFFIKLFPGIPWELANKLDYISLYTHVPLLAMVLYRLFPKESYRWFTKVTIIVTIFYDFLTLFTNSKTYLLFEVYFHLFMIICVGYSLVVVIKSLKSKHEERYYLLTGITFLMVTILLDISAAFLRLPEVDVYPVGIVFLVICFSLVISRRISTSLDLSKNLAKDLAQLNSGLEAKVEERTLQLQQSNRKLEELNDKLKSMALIDGLTNIPNRRQFDEYFKEQYTICAKENIPLSILFLDIDYFKNYNDWYGHQKGDECLIQVAHVLDKQINALPNGLAARYGGEEFVCLIPEADQAEAQRIAKNINQQIEQLKIPHEKSPVSNYVTSSVGLYTAIPQIQIDLNTALKQADKALYQAKAAGRNQVASCSTI